MAKKKTYGVRGLLECHLSIPSGGAAVKIHFSGGSMGSNGILPARYTTANPAVQYLIENSGEYKSGMIVRLSP